MIQTTDRDWARCISRLISTSMFQLQLAPAWCDMITLKKYLTRAGGKRRSDPSHPCCALHRWLFSRPISFTADGAYIHPYPRCIRQLHMWWADKQCSYRIVLFLFFFKCRHYLFPLLVSLSSYENWQTDGLETGAVAGKHISFPELCFENNLTQCYEKMWTTMMEKLALHEWLSRFEDM